MSKNNTKRRKLKKSNQQAILMSPDTPRESMDVVAVRVETQERDALKKRFPFLTHSYSESIGGLRRLHPEIFRSPMYRQDVEIAKRKYPLAANSEVRPEATKNELGYYSTRRAVQAYINLWRSQHPGQKHGFAGVKGLFCYRLACQSPNAWFWNQGSMHWYCLQCAIMLNKENAPFWKNEETPIMCVAPPDIPKEYTDTLYGYELRQYEAIVAGSPR